MRCSAKLDRRAKPRRRRSVRPGERDLGVQHVKVRQGGERFGKLYVMFAHERRQPEEQPPFLGRDIRSCEQQAIVEFDYGQRFDEERLARPGAVLDDAGEPRVKIRSHRNDEAVVARRNVMVGHHFADGLRTQDIGQPPFGLPAQIVESAPRGPQRRARRVSQVSVFVEATLQRGRELRHGGKARRIFVQCVGVRGLVSKEAGQPSSRFDHDLHVDELPPVHDDTVRPGAVQCRPDVGKGPERQGAVHLGQAETLPRAPAVIFHQPLVRLRPQCQTGGLSRGRHRIVGKQSEQGVELQGVQVTVAHTTFRRAAPVNIARPAGKTSK